MDGEFLSANLATDVAFHWPSDAGLVADSGPVARFGLRAGERGTDGEDGLGLGRSDADEIRPTGGSLSGGTPVKSCCQATSGHEPSTSHHKSNHVSSVMPTPNLPLDAAIAPLSDIADRWRRTSEHEC